MPAIPAVYRHSPDRPAIICEPAAVVADNQFMRLLCANRPNPLRHRIWIGTSLLGLLVAVVVISQVIGRQSDPSHRLELGGDFVPAYAAGTLVREGKFVQIYHLDAMERVERETVASADLEPLPFYGPYLNPPFFAAFYAPLSAIPFRQAALAWLLFSLSCVVVSLALLRRMLPNDRRVWALLPLLVFISMPFWQAMCHLQNTGLSLLILTAVVTRWRKARTRRDAFTAGLLITLLAYKPQLAALVMVSLSATLGASAMLGCVFGLGVLGIVTLLFMPGTISAYLHALPPLLRTIQERPQYNWGRQVTPQGFFRLALQGHDGGLSRPITTLLVTVCIVAALIGFGLLLWRHRKDATRQDQLIVLTICASPILMPYFMDYDLLLLAIPAVVISSHWIERGTPPGIARFAPAVWALLFISLYVNPGLSGQTRLNLAVLFVFATAIVSCGRGLWRSTSVTSTESAYTPLALAA